MAGWVSGNHHIGKHITKEEGVHLAMVALFCYKDALKVHNISQQARFYKIKVGEYFTFPENISKRVSIHDFVKIEKATEATIWLYQFVKQGKSHDIRLFRKRNNTSVHPDRVIYLCQIEDIDHIVFGKGDSKLYSVRTFRILL